MSDDYVNFLLEKLHSPAAVCQTLRMAYSENIDEMYVMHEGRSDRFFYGELLKRVKKKVTFRFFCCGSRSGVLNAHNYIDKLGEFDRRRLLYIIDRDYDKIITRDTAISKQIFVTDYYSIESYFIDESCISGILRDVICIPPDNGCLDDIRKTIYESIAAVSESMKALSAAIIAHKSNNHNIDQDLFPIQDCFAFSNCRVSRAKLGSRARALQKCGASVSCIEIRKFCTLIAGVDPRYWIRGKFYLLILRKLLEQAVERARLSIDPHRLQYRFSAAPLQGQGIYLFAGQHVAVPQSLIRYVRRIRAQRAS